MWIVVLGGCTQGNEIILTKNLPLTCTVYPKKYAHGFCFAVLCCDYTLTDFPISIRLTSLALWQSNDCPSASKATLMNMDKYFMWIHYERLYYHNKAKHNKTVCIFLGIYCTFYPGLCGHNNDVTVAPHHFKSPETWLFFQELVQAINRRVNQSFVFLLTGGFPSHGASNAESFLLARCHHHQRFSEIQVNGILWHLVITASYCVF